MTAFFFQENSNCFNRETERLARVDENEYEDSAGEIATITVQKNVLTILIDDTSIATQPVIEINAQDLPLCTATK